MHTKKKIIFSFHTHTSPRPQQSNLIPIQLVFLCQTHLQKPRRLHNRKFGLQLWIRKWMSRLRENRVYDIVPRSSVPLESKIFGTRWVFMVKSDYTYKGRVVCQGWSQRACIDCGATYAPVRVCRIETIRLLLAISTQFDLGCKHGRCQECFLTSQSKNRRFANRQKGTN